MKKHRLEHTFVCDMDWDSMPGNATHRHCDSCHRTIVNFSEMTEKKAYDLVTKMLDDDEMCGVFEVVGQRIVFQPEPISRSSKLAAAAAVVLPLMGGCDQPATTTAPIHTEARPVAVSPTPAGAVLTIEPRSNADELVHDEACDHEAYEAELARRNVAVLEAKSAMFDLLTPQDAAQSEVIVPDYPSKGIEEMHYRRIESKRLPGRMRAAPMPTRADRLE